MYITVYPSGYSQPATLNHSILYRVNIDKREYTIAISRKSSRYHTHYGDYQQLAQEVLNIDSDLSHGIWALIEPTLDELHLRVRRHMRRVPRLTLFRKAAKPGKTCLMRTV